MKATDDTRCAVCRLGFGLECYGQVADTIFTAETLM